MKFQKKEIVGMVTVSLNIDAGISFWQSIKLRIAGKGYEPIAKEIAEEIKNRMKENQPDAVCAGSDRPLGADSPKDRGASTTRKTVGAESPGSI